MIRLSDNYHFSRKQKIAAALLLVSGLAVGTVAEHYYQAAALTALATPSETGETAVTETSVAAVSAPRYADIRSSLTEIEQETDYEPAADILNLAYYYPEDADESDVINSYAGQIYKTLMTKDAQYIADIYDLGDITPLSMTKRLGLDSGRALGAYNPNDSSQSPDNPASWFIPNFKNVNITFYDGDGNRISEYSNVKDIMAMANVYMFAHDYLDAEAFEAYCLALYDKAHSYRVRMGEVYYCSGCLNKTIEEEAQEAIAEEEAQNVLNQSLQAGRTDGGSREGTSSEGLSSGDLLSFGDETAAEETKETQTVSEEVERAESSIQNEASLEETESQSEALYTTTAVTAGSAVTAEVPETAGEASTDGAPAENQDATEGTQSGTQSEGNFEFEAQGLEESPSLFEEENLDATGISYLAEVISFGQSQDTVVGSELVQEETQSSSEAVAVKGRKVDPDVGTLPEYGGMAGPGAENGTETDAGTSGTAFSGDAGSDSVSEEEREMEEALAAVMDAREMTVATASEQTTSATCPGHVDLYVTVTLLGFDDQNGLTTVDLSGDITEADEGSWDGWTEAARAAASALIEQDWFKRYGLTISAINVRNPLTQEEISAYLSRLPADISQERRAVISYALNSVGKIPYYYGGKAYAQGYDGNHFGTVVATPDAKGRILRGLDCSGWINWVYWSALGTRLAGESTGTLIGCGTRIQRADLQPGDIIIRTGADSHVVMFLEWSTNGNFIGIHETGGSVNNVTVAEMTANWPYYRKLIE